MQWMDGFGMTELIDIGCVPSTAESDKHEKNKALLPLLGQRQPPASVTSPDA